MDRPETAHIRSNGQLTLPVQVRRAAELQEGDVVEVVPQSDGTILLRPIAVLDRRRADQLFRLELDSAEAPVEDDMRDRVLGLLRRRQLPVTTGRKLDGLVERYQRGDLTRKAFIGEAIMLGLPAASIASLFAGTDQPDAEPCAARPAELAPASARSDVVRIVEAFHSLLYLPLYIAHDVGFFEDEGLTVEITAAGGGTEAWSVVESGLADYSVHDPVFTMRAYEQGVDDAVVVGTLCNGQAILALARDESIEATEDPRTFITETIVGRTVCTQPQPDSQWALLRFLRFIYEADPGQAHRVLQVPIGTEPEPVLTGKADLCLAFPPQADIAVSDGLREIFDFSRFFGPYLLSALATRREVVQADPERNEAVVTALEKACQYAHAFPDEAVRVAQREFPDLDAEAIDRATRRCLRRNFLPRHVAVDGEAWQESGVLNKFVGTIGQYRAITELVDNEAALRAYRLLGNLQMVWHEPRSITRVAHLP
ncbi:MAG: ABC transporter substrate-binding protein [Pseudonocardia sp.]|nr:ABC transporter substrate-binding protein [Pseudonocardia sp.]